MFRFPPPLSISPSGERPTTKLSENAKTVLKTWLSQNSRSPYPSQEEREELAEKAGLTQYQVWLLRKNTVKCKNLFVLITKHLVLMPKNRFLQMLDGEGVTKN